MPQFEVGKTYKTRKGQSRKVIHVDPRKTAYPVVSVNDAGHVFLVSRLGHLKTPTYYKKDGSVMHTGMYYSSSMDLVLEEELKNATEQTAETQECTSHATQRHGKASFSSSL